MWIQKKMYKIYFTIKKYNQMIDINKKRRRSSNIVPYMWRYSNNIAMIYL